MTRFDILFDTSLVDMSNGDMLHGDMLSDIAYLLLSESSCRLLCCRLMGCGTPCSCLLDMYYMAFCV